MQHTGETHAMRISVFDMLKIGVGPSSSHTMGPWRAAQRFLHEIEAAGHFDAVEAVRVDLFGSLAKTGRGHGTGRAVLMGLRGEDPATCDIDLMQTIFPSTRDTRRALLLGRKSIPFDPDSNLIYHFDRTLPFHPNGIRLTATLDDGSVIERTYYSVGGGFVVTEDDTLTAAEEVRLPYPCENSDDLRAHCKTGGLPIWRMVWDNEQVWRPAEDVRAGMLDIWHTMADCVYRGCHTEGVLPGGLNVVRRAAGIHRRLIGDAPYTDRESWLAHLRGRTFTFQEVIKAVSGFALAVNEENAAFGRVVTAPTNGAAGVIPAVLLHFVIQHQADDEAIVRFLLVAGEIGSLFKKGATISAAMGGCQAEIGVSSAMAAAALTEGLGGSVDQALMAAEIAMEHHLGMTCDPIGGLVQIPCIERNALGAMKAITAANLALEGVPEQAKISLDTVIKTMWQTALDMNDKYKETSEGGLAVHIAVNVAEC
jgi:L-serine dehydratase